MRTPHLAAATTVAALLLFGCAGDGPPPSGDGWVARIQSQVFDQNCLTAGCHNAQSAAAGLVLTEGQSYSNLFEVVPTNDVAREDGSLRVVPFSTDDSFLVRKLRSPGDGEGSRMPQGAEPLSEGDIQLIEDWINAGAPDDETPGATSTPTETRVPATAIPTATSTVVPPTSTASPTGVPPTGTAIATPTATAIPTDTPRVTIDDVQEQIFDDRCATPFCHSGEFPSAGLNLEDGMSFGATVGVPANNAAAAAEGLLRVEAGMPADSFLMIKVIDPGEGQGSLMPLVGPQLSAEEIDLIRRWIAGLDA